MNITLIEPFFTGSHKAWASAYERHSRHTIDIVSLSGNYWKWRMHGGAVTLARKFLAGNTTPDVILATDMLDLTTFLALTRKKTANIPVAFYFHESQICYPWLPTDRDIQKNRDHHYGFINYSSALAADRVFFNSQYHFDAFFDELPRFLKQFPDPNELGTVEIIREKSRVLSLGVNFDRLHVTGDDRTDEKNTSELPLILWNHRWEYDKNPEEFFNALYVLKDKGLSFHVAVLGESFRKQHPVFRKARQILGGNIVRFGYADHAADYAMWLYRADIVPVTSHHDFFGVSLVEALYCGCYPLLPKRLTYPELVPASTHPELFYEDFEDLVEKLEQAIITIPAIRAKNFRHLIDRYSWLHMAPEYDKVFTGMTNRNFL